MSDIQITISEFRLNAGRRTAKLVRVTDRTEDTLDEPFVRWRLMLDERCVASYDDELLPMAQQAAARLLADLTDIDARRAEVDTAEAAIFAQFERGRLRRPRHFTADDMAAINA